MLQKSSLRLLLLACGLQLALSLPALGATNVPAPEGKPAAGHVGPGPNDPRIAYVVAHNLEWYHYSQHLFDEAYSEKFFDRYLEALDPQHLHFLQSDLAEFSHYRTNLNHLTLTASAKANVDPAYEIFGRFLERLTERTAYAEELLKREKFDFDTDEQILINRLRKKMSELNNSGASGCVSSTCRKNSAGPSRKARTVRPPPKRRIRTARRNPPRSRPNPQRPWRRKLSIC